MPTDSTGRHRVGTVNGEVWRVSDLKFGAVTWVPDHVTDHSSSYQSLPTTYLCTHLLTEDLSEKSSPGIDVPGLGSYGTRGNSLVGFYERDQSRDGIDPRVLLSSFSQGPFPFFSEYVVVEDSCRELSNVSGT